MSIPVAKVVPTPEPTPDPGAVITVPSGTTITGTVTDSTIANTTPTATQQSVQAAGSPPAPVNKTVLNAAITYSYDLASGTFGALITDNKTNNVYVNLYDAILDFTATQKSIISQLNSQLSDLSIISNLNSKNTLAACVLDVNANFQTDIIPFKNYLNQISQITSSNVATSSNSILGDLASAVDFSIDSSTNPMNLALQFQSANNLVSTVAQVIGGQLGSSVASAISAGATLLGGNNPSPVAANNPPHFMLADYIESITVNTVPISVTTFPKLSESTSIDTEGSTAAFIAVPPTKASPVDPTKTVLTQPDNRPVNNIGLEPTKTFNAQYPYNKTQQTEGGHIIEIDDTPDNKRILTQHVSGTYDEMHDDGSKVTKVVKDNYLIVANDNFVSIHGKATLHIDGDINLRVGGSINIISDGGINFISQGDMRMIAKSISMETTGGDITAKSAQNTTLTSGQAMNIKSQSNRIDSDDITSIAAGAQLIATANKFSADVATDFAVQAGAGVYLTSSAGTNINAGAPVAITTPSLEVDGTLNAKQTTNLLSSGNPVIGQGAATASTASIDEAVPATESKGSGIGYSSNPAMAIEENDDDPEASAAAIQHGLANGTIDRNQLNTPPGDASASDTGNPGKTGSGIATATIGSLGGSTPPDNMRLSPHFTVGQLSKYSPAGSHIIKAQLGLSITDIVSNLQLVCVNCLEPILAKYPEMRPTSGFRTLNNGKSQHEKGQAVDIQFASANRNPSLYYEYAQWIKANVIFDQLLLEYKSTGTGLPWIHISFNGKKNRHQVLTLYNGATHSQGLSKLK